MRTFRRRLEKLDRNAENEKCVSQREKPKQRTEQIVKADIDLVITDYKQYIQKEHLVNDLTLSKYVFRLRWLSH